MEKKFRKPLSKDVQLSKALSYLLRHGAEKEKLEMDNAGFVKVEDIIQKKNIISIYPNINLNKIKEIVETNDKKRYELKEDPEKGYLIRATQGHTIEKIEDEELLEKITDVEVKKFNLIVHGTYHKFWKNIQKEGLKAMSRNHIHMAIGMPKDKEVVSGIRLNCEIFIEINLEKALKDNIPFYYSKNNVILTRGIDGVLPVKYFKKVTQKNGAILLQDKNSEEDFIDLDNKNINENVYINKNKNQIDNEKLEKNLEDNEKNIEKKIKLDNNEKEIINYKYLAVIDFEAQCSNKEKLKCQEIIEFPVVVVDVEKQEIQKDFFHNYVKPEVHPILTDFCKELTGISQDQVEKGIPLKITIARLDIFLQKSQILNDFIFVTCGDWDLKTCLPNEARFKKIEYPEYLKSWINVKFVYKDTLKEKTAKIGMAGMLKGLNLELEGRHHSGIDDAKNIARIALELIKKGGKFNSEYKKDLKMFEKINK